MEQWRELYSAPCASAFVFFLFSADGLFHKAEVICVVIQECVISPNALA